MTSPLGLLPAAGSAVQGASGLQSAGRNIMSAAAGVGNAIGGQKTANIPAPLNVTLSLGAFVFQDMEVPEVLPFHGAQRLSVKTMIGGTRQIDALGTDLAPITWSGTFWPTAGQTALDRAKMIELMRDAGQPINLIWDTLSYSVYISDFNPDYRFARIPYSITVEILADLTAPATAIVNPTVDDIVGAELSKTNQLLSVIASIENLSTSLVNGVAALNELVGAVAIGIYAASSNISSASSAAPLGLNSTSASVSSLMAAPPSVINPIMAQLLAAIHQASTLSIEADSVLINVSGPGGMLVGVSIGSNIAAFEALLAANDLQANLLQIDASLKTMQMNLAQINSSARTITVSGGNLYDIAAKEYGDAAGAALIMQANGLIDPTITGNTTLIIPPYNAVAANGGVLAS